ncbi:hypothetical protein FSARC_8026, partial [Fusarium sarcochroum]
MAAEEFDPGEVIYLSSDDEPPAPTKKRTFEDTRRSNSPNGQVSSAPDPKRLRTDARGITASEIVVAVDEESKPTADSASIGKSSTQSSTPSDSALGNSGELPDYKQGTVNFKVPNLANKKGGSWLNRFKDWVRAFHALNVENSDAITSSLAQSAYAYYIDHHAGLKPKKKKNAKQVAKELESTGELEALLRSLQPSSVTQSTLDTWVKRQPRKEPVRKGKRSRASSVSEGEIDEADEQESESEAEYEPTLSKNERTGEDAKEGSGNNAQTNGNSTSDASNHQNLPPINTHRNVPTGNDALEQQRKYFPSANDPAQMCILCGLNTHLAPSCPTLVCSSCGSLDHPDICCPEKERCDKCRQLGHQAAHCTEKLALTKEEGLACAICNSTDHFEKQCTQVWRSFHPDTYAVKKVAFIPASCSMCGSDRHFSSDCNRRRDSLSNPTWSLKNRDQYVDPDCGMAAIEEATGGPQNARSMRAPELKIRGHAARTTNVHYSDDDSEVEFLGHKRVQKPAAVGQIRVASNIQMPNTQNGRPRRRGRQDGAPPLPPGPPPTRGSFGHPPPSGPPPSLPRKPPARDYRNVPPPQPLQASQGQGPKPRG